MGDLDFFSILIFIAGGFAASAITALAGFAFGIIAAGPWLHALTPSQTTALIVAYGLLVQGYSVWKLRSAIQVGRLLPFLIGGAIGCPLGVQLLGWVSATHLRLGVGVVLITYGAYGLLRPNLPSFAGASRFIDALVGLFGGVLGGATGLAGIVVMIWSGLRGWSKDEQRAVFQPAGVANFAMIALWIGASERLTATPWFCLRPVCRQFWPGYGSVSHFTERPMRRAFGKSFSFYCWFPE